MNNQVEKYRKLIESLNSKQITLYKRGKLIPVKKTGQIVGVYPNFFNVKFKNYVEAISFSDLVSKVWIIEQLAVSNAK